MRALLGASPKSGAHGDQKPALFAVLYRGGLRVSEALALESRNVDAAAGTGQYLR